MNKVLLHVEELGHSSGALLCALASKLMRCRLVWMALKVYIVSLNTREQVEQHAQMLTIIP